MLANLFDLKGLLLVALIFVPLEWIIPLRAEQKFLRKHWLNDLTYVFANTVLVGIGLIIVLNGPAAALHPFVPRVWLSAVASQPLWLQVVEVIVLADLGFYFAHRMFHSVPMLWKFHVIHHSIEELDWLAAYRVHPLDQVITKMMSYLPALVLGFSPAAVLIFGLIYKWHALILHANTRISFGPFRWLFASPRFHHWHHADHVEAYDKNFAGQLSFIDYIFGTLRIPDGTPAQYGSGDKIPPFYHQQLFHPFKPAKAVRLEKPSEPSLA